MAGKEITSEQAEEIKCWIKLKDGQELDDFSQELWLVNGEPLIIREKTSGAVYLRIGNRDLLGSKQIFVNCSEKHAKELEEAGIVKFGEKGKEKSAD